MKTGRRQRARAALAVALLALSSGALLADELPAALYQDPAPDAAHPASTQAVQFESHGGLLNAEVFRPGGAGPHPTAILFHGLPGNDQTLDIAYVMRRAGWTVVTFHYTGSWGSAGKFTLRRGVEDAAALIHTMQRPEIAAAWGTDPKRLILIGHSYGGYVAACAAAYAPGLQGVVLLTPWDISTDYRQWHALGHAAAMKAGAENYDDVDGRLAGTNHELLTRETLEHGFEFDLSKQAAALAAHPVLVITATRDSEDDQAGTLLQALHAIPAAQLTAQVIETDHSFSDQRIALQATVVRWVAALRMM